MWQFSPISFPVTAMRTLHLIAGFFVFLIPVQTFASFIDVDASHSYIQAIEWGQSSNVIAGYPDGSFKPERTVNRAEFLKIILEAVETDVSTAAAASGFVDVDENAWYAPYVRYAKQEGIVQGYADGTFKPEQTVNFAEALKMAYEAMKVSTTAGGTQWYDRYLSHARTNSILFSVDADMSSDMRRKDVVWIAWKLSLHTNPSVQVETPRKKTAQSNMLTSGNLYPINLLNNQQWKIRITAPVNVVDQQDAFEVTRNHDRFTVIAYEVDQKTGNLRKSYTQDYGARFKQRYTDPHDDFLEVYRCWYKYEYIQEGFTCHYARVPAEIDQRDVIGDDEFSALITTVSDEFEVEILSKSAKEIECNIKGEVHEGQKIYHLRGSKFYGDLKTGFKCFETETEAKKEGYKKSFSER